MREPTGHYLPLPGPRKFIGDLVHFARRIPSAPVARTIRYFGPFGGTGSAFRAAVVVVHFHEGIRVWWELKIRRCGGRCSNSPGRGFIEHPWMNCAMAIERVYQGEEGVFVGIFRAPEQQTLSQLQQAVAWYKNETLEKVGFYRMALRFSKAPTPLRRLLWWGTLNISGFKRSKRFGTFGLSSYGALGAEQIHPISPLSTTLDLRPD